MVNPGPRPSLLHTGGRFSRLETAMGNLLHSTTPTPRQKAVIIRSPQQAALVYDHPIPALRDGYMRIRTVAVAVNPCDWKQVDGLGSPGTLLGCDYAGIVEEVAPGGHKSFKKGDRVCGMVHGANSSHPEDGAFAEFIIAKADLQIRMPDHLSFEEAATLGVGVSTVALGLYRNLCLDWPTQSVRYRTSILIYGGSTATGVLAIQFAKLSGAYVYATCSPHNFELVRSLGADVVCDYHELEAADLLRDMSGDGIRIALDCITDEHSAKFCYRALSTRGADYSHINRLPPVLCPQNIQQHFVGAFTVLGEEFCYGNEWYNAVPSDKFLMEKFVLVAEDALASKAVRPHHMTVGSGGLIGILDGMDRLREGQVSGQKLVYRVTHTV